MPVSLRRSPKTVAVLLAAVAFGAAACGSSKATGSSKAAPTAKSTLLGTPHKATGSPIKIGVVDDGNTPSLDNSQIVTSAQAVASYANAYLGGLNGHPIQIDSCATQNTPSGGTTCGVQMVHDKVAAVLDSGIAQAASFYSAVSGSGIPYIALTSATPSILTKPGAFVLENPIAAIAAPAAIAKAKGVTRAAEVIINVPAATGPIEAIAKPVFQKAGIKLDVVPISPSVADVTPQIEQAIAQGDKLFTVIGTDPFSINVIRALKQLGFSGVIISGFGNLTAQEIAAVPGGLKGVVSLASASSSPNNKGVKLFNAIAAKYASGMTENGSAKAAYQLTLGFIRALEGVTSAVNASSIETAFNTMPKPVALPLGSGIQFQCGQKGTTLAPNSCSTGVLESTLNANGVGQGYKLVNVSQYTK